MRPLVRLLSILAGSSSMLAAHAQTGPVPLRGVNYGPGRVDAGYIFNYVGQAVSACGRVGSVDERSNVIIIADNLRVFMPPGHNVRNYWGTIACARGLVNAGGGPYEGRYAVIEIQNPNDLEVIGGSGPYNPPQPQCGPGEMPDPTKGCVKRWRAPYGGR